MKTITIPAAEAKLHFGDWLNRCAYGGEEIIITRHDKPVAILVSLEEWKRVTENKDKKLSSDKKAKKLHPLVESIRKTRQEYWDSVTPENRKKDIDAVTLVRMIREEGYDK